MKKILVTALFGVSAGFVSPAWAENAALCAWYERTFDFSNMEMAYVDSKIPIVDSKIPSASDMEVRILNERIKQLITLQQMTAHGCELPKKISSKSEYSDSAKRCLADISNKRNLFPNCDRTKWKSKYENPIWEDVFK